MRYVEEAMPDEPPPRADRARQPAAAGADGAASPPLRSHAAIYEENVEHIYAFIFSRVGRREVAQDVTADVFVKALALVDPAQDAATIRSWLFRVARTTVADYWRATLRSRVIPLDEMRDRLRDASSSPGDEPPSPQQTAARAWRVLDRLPPNYRDVLILRFVRGYSLREAAETLGTTEGNVKVLQHRAIHKARDLGLEEG